MRTSQAFKSTQEEMSIISSLPNMTENGWCSTLYISQDRINYFSSTIPLQVWNIFLLDCMFGLTTLLAWCVSSISLIFLPVITVMFILIQKYRRNFSQHYNIACSEFGNTVQTDAFSKKTVLWLTCVLPHLLENNFNIPVLGWFPAIFLLFNCRIIAVINLIGMDICI